MRNVIPLAKHTLYLICFFNQNFFRRYQPIKRSSKRLFNMPTLLCNACVVITLPNTVNSLKLLVIKPLTVVEALLEITPGSICKIMANLFSDVVCLLLCSFFSLLFSLVWNEVDKVLMEIIALFMKTAKNFEARLSFDGKY